MTPPKVYNPSVSESKDSKGYKISEKEPKFNFRSNQ
jgi:hypothetical protein